MGDLGPQYSVKLQDLRNMNIINNPVLQFVPLQHHELLSNPGLKPNLCLSIHHVPVEDYRTGESHPIHTDLPVLWMTE